MNKKKFLLIATSVLSFGTISLALFSGFYNNYVFASGDQNSGSYRIVCNSTKNKFFSGTGSTGQSGNATIKTNLDNDIDFTYSDVAGGSSSVWHLIKPNGYFYNTTPIHGLNQATFVSTSDDKQFTIYWGNDTDYTLGSESLSSSQEGTSFSFNGDSPTYFKVINTSGSNLSFTNIDINFECRNHYPVLNISSENEDMGTVSGSGTKVAGQSVTIVATPNSGYKFVGWYSGSELISSNASYTFNIGYDDLNYVAKFTYQSYNLIVQSESLTKGTVSESSGEYDYLENITISANANNGYTFSGWYKESTLVSDDNPYSFNMPHNDITYTAKFSTNSYDLSLVNNNPDLGSISGDGTFLYGSNVTVTATPNIGVSFLGWYDDGDNLVSSNPTYTFTMPYEDIQYIAKFAWTPYSITLSVNDDSMGSVTGDGSYTHGQQVNLTATPNEHYSFFGWYDDSTLLSQETTYSFSMPNKSLNYSAKFVKNYNLNVYSDDDSMGSVSAPTEWGVGLEVTVSANPNTGYVLDYWGDENYDEVSYDASYSFIMPEHDVELIACFATGYTFTVTSSDESKGSVSGGGQYKAGQSVTATMNHISGIFKGWYDVDDNLVSKSNPYTFTMPTNDYSLEAIFTTQEWDIAHGVIPNLSDDEKTITYGLYPQTNVSNSSLISALNKLTTPESNGWYLYEDEYYAKVSATPYSTDYTFDNGRTIASGTKYWFKCEPITWNVLSNNDGEYYILSSVLLDAHRYNEYYTGTKDGHYANNYEYSEIRAWLNNEFYNSAFALGNSNIQLTNVDNSAATTDSMSNPYVCNNTQDKVFFPSYKDYINSSYGFSTSTNSTETRYCKTTDWARARGAYCNIGSSYLYNSSYWIRSPYSDDSNPVWTVYSDGSIYRSSDYLTYLSVRPALTIKIA